jgi:adenylate kinase
MIIMMGIAGSGKGTQGKLLSKARDLEYVSTGDMLRAHADSEQQARILNGELLSDDEMFAMLDKVIMESSNPDKILLDGFPRTVPQAQWLIDRTKQNNFGVSQVFHLKATREAAKARLIERGRSDDHEDAIEERFNEYEKQTQPVLDWLEQAGVKVIDVNAEQTVEEVNRDLMAQLEQ